MDDLNAYWLAKGTEQLARARAGTLEVELTYDVAGLPDTWLAAELLTFDQGTEWELGAGHILGIAHALQAKPTGDIAALLAQAAEAASGDARIAALEAAWRACFAPEIADAIEALDAHRDAPAMPVAKKKKDTEALWVVAAETAPPRSLFASDWPKTWRDAQRRMRPMYRRPRSPLFAAAAIDFTKRDPLPYTSIASTTYWQAHAWFIAEQGDVRQLAALEAFEARMARMGGGSKVASDALRAFEPRALPAKAAALLAKLAVPAKPARAAKLSLASPEERGVAADQLLLDGDPRGELITVQEQIAKKPTPDLVARQAQLLKKHAKAWVPGTVYRDTCVFRGGVPVAGHLMCRSDPELASMAGSQALATLETVIIDRAFAMGDISPSTIAEVVASLPALRCVITSDEGALAIARGNPTALEHIRIEGDRVGFDGPGAPKLARLDVSQLRKAWLDRPWFQRLTAIGFERAPEWDQWRAEGLAAAIVLTAPLVLHRQNSSPGGWELWADRNGNVTAKHVVGSNAANLLLTLESITSWKTIETLRVPKNFVDGIAPFARQKKVDVKPIAAVEPIREGISLELASARPRE